MKPQTTQMALKGSLLMILAANISWQTAKTYNVSDLSSRAPAETVGGNGGVPGRINVVRIERETTTRSAPTSGPRPDAPISSSTLADKESTEFKTVCEDEYKIRFAETTENNKKIVRAYVSSRTPAKQLFSYWNGGSFKALIADINGETNPAKIQFDKLIETKIRKEYCNTHVADEKLPKTDGESEEEESREDIITRGMVNCALDKDGKPLKNSARYTCNLNRLQKITLETNEIEDEDEDSTRPRKRRSRSNGMAQIENALRPLKNSIKSLLLSSKEERREEGLDRLEDVVSALEDIRETAEAREARTLTKMIEGLKSGFTVGARVNTASYAYDAALSDLDDQIADVRSELNAAPMHMQGQPAARLQNLLIQKVNVQQAVLANKDYLQFQTLAQREVIDSVDYVSFASNYTELLARIRGGANGATTNTLATTAPSDLSAQRQAYAASNIYGPLPAPSVNYSLLGLPNPTASTAIPPSFGTSGQTNFGSAPATQFNQFPQANGQQFAAPGFPQQYPQNQFPQQYPNQYPQQFPNQVRF